MVRSWAFSGDDIKYGESIPISKLAVLYSSSLASETRPGNSFIANDMAVKCIYLVRRARSLPDRPLVLRSPAPRLPHRPLVAGAAQLRAAHYWARMRRAARSNAGRTAGRHRGEQRA